MTVSTDEAPKRRSNLVVGPDGFTETFDDRTVDLLVRMGLVKWTQTSSDAHWETKFYEATGRPPMNIG